MSQHSNKRKFRMQDKPTAAIKIRGNKPEPEPVEPEPEPTYEVKPRSKKKSK